MGLSTHLAELPTLGIGLGYRRIYHHDLMAPLTGDNPPVVDWVEITPENCLTTGSDGKLTCKGGQSWAALADVTARFPCTGHGVSLSLGSIDPLNTDYLAAVKVLYDELNPHWVSDHLCFSSTGGEYFNDLLPLPRTPATASYVADRIKHVEDVLQRPFLVEHISYYAEYPDNTLSDGTFTDEVVTQANCGLLLDVNNIVVNGHNHGVDPQTALLEFPLDHVVEIHMAGYTDTPNGPIDTHAEAVTEEVWALLANTLTHCQPKGVLLERDGNFPPYKDICDELIRLRELWADAKLPSPCLPPALLLPQTVLAH